jgi:hypothetical protein
MVGGMAARKPDAMIKMKMREHCGRQRAARTTKPTAGRIET